MRIKWTILPCMVVLLAASPALAAYEYYTYDGFEPITRAFVAISHIFKNNQLVLLAAVGSVIGMTMAGIAFFVRSLTGAQVNPVNVFLPAIVGMGLYLAMFTRTETLIVYDTHTGQFQGVPEVPLGIVYIASAINDVEVGLVGIIETAFGGAGSVQQAAGAYNLLTAGSFLNPGVVNAQVYASVQSYIEDCATFEILTNPGGALNPEALRKSKNFMPLMAQAKNPAIFTQYYDAATPNGASVSCEQAWDNLEPILNNPATFAQAVINGCGAAGFTASAQQVAKCRSLAEGFLNSPSGFNLGGATLETTARQGLIAEALFNVIQNGAPLTGAAAKVNRDMATKGMGTLVAANEWLPYFKAGMTAVALGLIPIMAVFIATPLVGQALSFIFGIFVFLAAWGVADAVATASGAIYTTNLASAIRDTGLGLDTYVNFPDYNTKMVSVFATLRSMAVAFAGLISMMLVKFGGHFLAGMASNIMGQVQGAGAAGGALLTPEGKSQAMGGLVSSVGAQSWLNSNDFGTMGAADAYGRQNGTEGYKAAVTMSNALGMGLPEFAQRSQLHGNLAMDDGRHNFTMTPDGRKVASNVDQSHGLSVGGTNGTPVLAAKASNLGVVGAEASEGAEAAAKQQLTRQSGIRTGAGNDLSTAVRSSTAAAKALEEHVRDGARRGDSEAMSLKEGFEVANQEQNQFIKSLAARHTLSDEQAHLMAASLSAGVEAGFSGPGKGAAEWLTGFSAKIGGGYKLTADDRSKVASLLQNTKSDDWKEAQTVTNSHNAALNMARSSDYVQSSEAGRGYSDRVGATREETVGSGQSYRNEWTKEESMRNTLETAAKNGIMGKENLSPELQEHLYNTPGLGGAAGVNQLLAAAGTAGPGREAAMATLRPAVNDFVDQKVKNLFAGDVGTEVANRGKEIEAGVEAKQGEIKEKVGEQTPDQHYAGNAAAVQTQATAAGVAPGTNPDPVHTSVGVPSRGAWQELQKKIETEGQEKIQPGADAIQGSMKKAEEVYQKDVKETSKPMALLQNAGGEGYGAVQALLRGSRDLAEELTAGPQRMEQIVKPALNNPESPYSPKNHFTNGSWTFDPQGKDKPAEDTKKPADGPPPKAPWQGR